jgi:formylglycine-generating enzyme required for sulfatase activity
VLLPGGQFTLGSDSGEADEQPAHRVQLSPFYLDITEVTQDSYQRLMGTNPSKWKAPERPVERVNWVQAVQYCNLRSQREGLQPCYDLTTFQCDFSADGYRLPTEAEWEYACRAGTTTAWSSGDSATDLEKHAWLKPSAANTTHPVRQKAPNAWGLYDMHGNVAEWCHDFYAEGYGGGEAVSDPRGPAEGEERVVRGGNFALSAQACRCSARASMAPAFADACFGAERQGFRCVRRAEAVKQP